MLTQHRVLFSAVATLALAHVAQAMPVPLDLNPGDTYFLAFVTEGTRDAASSNIADYNNFVQAQATLAGLQLDNSANPVTWKAIGSTATVDARDNIGNIIAPIYRMDLQRVANDETDLFDGPFVSSIISPILLDQFSTPFIVGVWTGSDSNGTQFLGNALGSSEPFFGLSGTIDQPWISFATAATNQVSNNPFHLYAISSALTVPTPTQALNVPEPATALLLTLGALVLTARGKSRQLST